MVNIGLKLYKFGVKPIYLDGVSKIYDFHKNLGIDKRWYSGEHMVIMGDL
jgi:hypothetical protein